MENGSIRPLEILAPNGLRLKQFTPSDSTAIFMLIDRNREHLSQFGEQTGRVYFKEELVLKSITNPANPNRMRFGIWNNSILMGSINLTPDKDNNTKGEMGYYLGLEFTKNGYMGLAVNSLTKFAFDSLGYTEIYAKVHPDNFASQKVLMKAGFIQSNLVAEGILFILKKSHNFAFVLNL